MSVEGSAVDLLDSCRRCYAANMAALYRADPALAMEIERVPFARVPPLERARNGEATVRLTADDGASVYAHSRVRPREEAKRLVASLSDDRPPTFVVSGAGLGYVIRALEERFDRPVVILSEDDLALFKAALCVQDLSGIIGERRLIVLRQADRSHVYERLNTCNADLMLSVQFVKTPVARRYHAAFHAETARLLSDFTEFTRTQMVTLLGTARITCRNVLNNLPAYLNQPGLEVLRDVLRGYPAIIVAAGPSLARHLRMLRGLRERAAIVAVQTVFKLLLSLEIEPHFVTSLDFHEVSAEFFRGVRDVGACRLVAEPKATPRVLDMYPGRRYVLHHATYETLLGEADPRHAGLKAGSTVAHLAFYLAQHLGCDPIVFVGQDLAFTEGLFYLPGSPIEQIWAPELGRFQTVEMKQWERIVRNRPILRRICDLHGRPTYTDSVLFTYAEQFQTDFATCTARVIQATEGGQALEGAEVMPLREVAARFCTRPLPEERLAQADASPHVFDADAVRRRLETRYTDLSQVRRIAGQMRDLLPRLEELVHRPREFNRLVARVDELRTAMHRHDDLYRLVVDVSTAAELQRYQADRQLGTVQRETPESARRRLRRDREFVQAFCDGCDYLLKIMDEALARLREATA